MSEPLITKYRPKTFEEVLGQRDAVKVMQSALEEKRAQVFALVGPSGTGKTTLSRIACDYAKVDPRQILEVDGASYSGVEDARKLAEQLRYRPIGQSGGRAAIVDECHRLSANAWDALLKATEEPKAGAYWFFCTTNPAKIPKTIMTRACKVTLKLVPEKDIDRLVMQVVRAENLRIADSAIDVVIREANGSPRQALSYLVNCADAENKAEALRLIHEVEDVDAALEFCRFVVKGNGSWSEGMELVDKLKDSGAEGIRIQVMNYLGVAIKNAKSDKAAVGMLPLLEAFSVPYNQSEGFAPLMLSLGKALYKNG